MITFAPKKIATAAVLSDVRDNFQEVETIDLLAILQKSLDRAIFLYNFILQVR